MLPAILICAFMVKYAAIQAVTVTASLGTTKSCVVEARDDVKLLCTVSSGCCGSARVWEKVVGAVSLLNNGLSTTDPSKYVEDYDGGGTGGGSIEFNLIIKNVQKSDFGINYQCRYGVTSSNKLFLNNILCDCWKCAGRDYGWSILGALLLGTVIIMIIAKVKIGDLKTVLKVGGLTFIISVVVNLFALLIGYYKCHCVAGTDTWFILLGLGTSGITGVIVLHCVPTVKVQHSSYVVTTGETMTLVCTVTSRLTISSVQWERNVGGSTTTIDSNTNINKYSGSTATKPSLTILKAASSDEGTYRCFASNCVGTGQSTTIIVGDESTDEDGI